MLLFILFSLIIPVLSRYLVQKIPLLNFLGSVVLCYILGILLVNVGLITPHPLAREWMSSISVPLAIGLLLLTGNLKAWFQSAPRAVLSFMFVVSSTLIMSVLAYLLFKDKLEGAHYYAGLIMAVYSGGSANMAAVNLAAEIPPGYYDKAMIADVIWGGFYLIFIMGIAPHLYKGILKSKPTSAEQEFSPENYTFRIIDIGKGVALVALATGISAGLSLLLFGKTELNFLILMLTALCALFSFSAKVRSWKSTQLAGDYFLLVFAAVMGLSSDLSLFQADALQVFYYMGFVLLGSMLLHLLLSYLFKIDRDTHIITNAAAVMSPPFIPGIVASLNRPGLLMSGLSAGIIGNLLGNYLGIILIKILS